MQARQAQLGATYCMMQRTKPSNQTSPEAGTCAVGRQQQRPLCSPQACTKYSAPMSACCGSYHRYWLLLMTGPVFMQPT